MGNQILDAGTTATKTPRKKHPRQGTIQWGRIRKEWEAGGSTTQIAYRHGITYDAIWKRSKREGWVKPDREQVSQQVSQPASPVSVAVKERLGRHFATVLSQVETLQRGIDEHSCRRLEVEELKTLSTTLDNLDRIARRTFGLDSPGGGSPGSLLATVAPNVLCPVVDVDPVPAPVLPAEPG